MFEIMDGRGSFWQWDLNQKLVVQDLPNGAEVHFSNCNSDYALVTLVKTVDGKNVCDVPNVVLQKAGYVNVFAYVIEGEEKHTEYKASILILARSKPEDYIYTETETLCYKNLSEKIGDVSLLETDAKENLVDAVNEIAKKAASGADLSLGITGAEAGQIATVEAVDDQGKPTKWKHKNIAGAVGFPAPTVSDNGKYLGCENGAAKWLPVEASGGGSKQEKIIDVTFDEEFNAAEISVDINGNPFLLAEFTLWFKVALVATGSYNYFRLSVNEGSVLQNLPGMNFGIGTDFSVYGCFAKVRSDGSVYAIYGAQSNMDSSDARFAPIVGLSSVKKDTEAVNYGNGVYKINISGTHNTLAKGTRLIVYGVRK